MTFRYDDQTNVEKDDFVRIIKTGAWLSCAVPMRHGMSWVHIPLPVGAVLRYAGQATPAYASWGTVPFFIWYDEAENVHRYGRLPEIIIHSQTPGSSDTSFYEVVA